MKKDEANESLLDLVGELLYKNQLLREAIASKDEVIELIINHLMNAGVSACSCGVANQLAFVRNTLKERNVELSHRICTTSTNTALWSTRLTVQRIHLRT